jgi:MFS family permease
MLTVLTLVVCVLLVVDVLVASICANSEKPFWALALVAGGAYLVSLLVGAPIVPFVQENWTHFPLWFGIYVLLGIPWAFVKWWRYAVVARKKLKAWLVKNPIPESDAERRNYAGYVPGPIVYNSRTNKFELPASDHKARITTWLAFWPLSIVGTALEDFLIRLWERIYDALRTSFQRVADSVLADVNK